MKKFDINKIQERELFCAGLEVRESGDGQGRTISGHAIVFDRESNILWQDDEEVAVEIIDREAIPQELLDNSDIKMTMYHNREKLLARSNKGSGTLSYAIDDTGVSFSFQAGEHGCGPEALELVQRGDITGCSFMFTTHYWDEAFVSRTLEKMEDGRTKITFRVKAITSIRDFTLAASPAYPQTDVDAREQMREIFHKVNDDDDDDDDDDLNEERRTKDEGRSDHERDLEIRREIKELREKAAAILRSK